ncbi:MAG: type II secretion system ATPase GspE [Victivallales bacterium]|nr:type II secretion system ATPase GspE [Victivallales bacterium]MCF7888502.1 type II secretion system ATPase GspE [Victivallales bacterium]
MNITEENTEYALLILKEKKLINDEQIKKAKEAISETDEKLSIFDALIREKFTTEQKILKTLAEEYGMEYLDLDRVKITQEVLDSIPASVIKEYNVLPVKRDEVGDTITVAMNDPTDLNKLDSLRYVLKCDVDAVVAQSDKLMALIEHHYGSIDENVDTFLRDMDDDNPDNIENALMNELDEGGMSVEEDDAPIIKLVSVLIMEAFKKRASDIHLEPLLKKFRIRYRIDGVLNEVDGPPKYLQSNVVSRIKIMAGMDIAEKRVPQDGRIQLNVGNKSIDLRVSTIPTSHGESVVMRILDKSSILIDISTLGFMDDDIAAIKKLITMPDGIFLVTGPTGSGKTTTLYSFLNTVNQASKKIITVEDPVEYHLEGINQVQVKREVKMDFARALRAMMRQSPNIVMVGEIRDAETAEIAINAALTGHLVFSTLHTNDAPGAISRLIDIGVKPFLVASSVQAILAQRLVRKVCTNCAVPYEVTDQELEFLGLRREFFANGKLLKGRGCAECNNSGYKGRLGIFELFLIDENMQDMIFKGVSSYEIKENAIRGGMRTLRQDGLRKVLAGMTTIQEIIRVTVADT